MKVNNFLHNFGMRETKTDSCVYYNKEKKIRLHQSELTISFR